MAKRVLLCDNFCMRVARINVDKNIKTINGFIAKSGALPGEVKKSIEENNEVIQILLDRLAMSRKGRTSSERSPSAPKDKKDGKGKDRNQLPSKRYPDIPVIEKEIFLDQAPFCPCCNERMKDSGLREALESLTVIPKKYIINRELRVKYNCGHCHGSMTTVPAAPRITPGSSYSDEMVLDVALSKYCDLIPMERYAQMANRNGLEGLPANSLIGLTHHLANFLEVVYLSLKAEVQSSLVVHADETPHRMLERGGKKQWYLWGFSSRTAAFFQAENTRSGTVASGFLKTSDCLYLVSDVFSGYGKAVSDVNVYREEKGIALLKNAYCNAHARRKFKEAEENFPGEVKTFIHSYREIYRMEREVKVSSAEEGLKKRSNMEFYFEEMRRESVRLEGSCSPHSTLGKAIGYYQRNYSGLTVCLKSPEVPLDNNQEERLLRSPVVGRKTWYGNHSKRGARTGAVLFSLVEACKLNRVNPREYFPFVVEQIHQGKDPPTPYEYIRQYEGPGPAPPA